MNVEEMVKRLNPILRGWANYFRVANCKALFEELAAWIRRRLRMKQQGNGRAGGNCTRPCAGVVTVENSREFP